MATVGVFGESLTQRTGLFGLAAASAAKRFYGSDSKTFSMDGVSAPQHDRARPESDRRDCINSARMVGSSRSGHVPVKGRIPAPRLLDTLRSAKVMFDGRTRLIPDAVASCS